LNDENMKLIMLKDVLARYLDKFALKEKSQKVYQLWETEIGNLKRHSHLLGIKGGYLEVEVDSPVARQEFSLRKEKIIQKINKKIGGNYLKGMHFYPIRNFRK